MNPPITDPNLLSTPPLAPINDDLKFFLANVGFRQTATAIQSYIALYFGPVNFVKLVPHRDGTEGHRGYGFLHMLTVDGAAALEKYVNAFPGNKIRLAEREGVYVARHDEQRAGAARAARFGMNAVSAQPLVYSGGGPPQHQQYLGVAPHVPSQQQQQYSNGAPIQTLHQQQQQQQQQQQYSNVAHPNQQQNMTNIDPHHQQQPQYSNTAPTHTPYYPNIPPNHQDHYSNTMQQPPQPQQYPNSVPHQPQPYPEVIPLHQPQYTTAQPPTQQQYPDITPHQYSTLQHQPYPIPYSNPLPQQYRYSNSPQPYSTVLHDPNSRPVRRSDRAPPPPPDRFRGGRAGGRIRRDPRRDRPY